jgi:hypothetical protein
LRDDRVRAARWTDMNRAVPPGAIERKRAQPFYLQLWFLVLAAMVLGIALGTSIPMPGCGWSRSATPSSRRSAS